MSSRLRSWLRFQKVGIFLEVDDEYNVIVAREKKGA